MKYLLYLSTLVLSACSASMPGVHSNLRPMADPMTTPRVEFLGDDQIAAVVAYANNPLWKCTTCAQGQTSAEVLTDVPAVIALKPDLVVVQTGAYDLVADPVGEPATLYPNVLKILDAFEAAKIPAVICMLPGSSEYDDYYFNEALDLVNQSGMIPYVFTFNFTNSDLTAGLDYTQDGLKLVYPAFYQDVESFHVGGIK